MQGEYFGFYLPTFKSEDAGDPADRYWEAQRRARFLDVGLLGLVALDQQRELDRKGVRKGLRDHRRRIGLKVPVASRTGLGRFGTAVAYAELTDRVRTALRNMQQREHRLIDAARKHVDPKKAV